MRTRLMKNQRGAALLETAITLPIILLISVGIFEFGRAYQTWQVLTNAAREGARVAVIAGTSEAQIKQAVKDYAGIGNLAVADGHIAINQSVALGTWTGSEVTISFPFNFMMLGPIARLVNPSSTAGAPLTMTAVARMRNEG
jgi:Flp pilus assembly protein TadG